MKKLILSVLTLGLALFALPSESWAQPKLEAQIYELRTYTTHEGALPKLHARFRDHTNHIFVKAPAPRPRNRHPESGTQTHSSAHRRQGSGSDVRISSIVRSSDACQSSARG